MIAHFFIVCKECFLAYQNLEESTLCNIHHDPSGIMVLTCFECGKEEVFKPEQFKKTTKKQAELM